MEKAIRKLEAKKVINREDILILKDYIGKKYTSHTSSQKSDILSKAIHQVLDKNIEGLDKNHGKAIKQELLRNNLLGDSQAILLVDIFYSYISIKDMSSDFIESLANWTNLHIENKISKVELESYIKDEKHIESIVKEEQYDKNNLVIDKTENNIKVENVDTYNDIQHRPENSYKLTKRYVNMKMVLGLSSVVIVFILILGNKYIISKKIIKSVAEAINKVDIKREAYSKEKAHDNNESNQETTVNSKLVSNETTVANKQGISSAKVNSNLPQDFLYKEVNKSILQVFLREQNSLLAEEPYFSTIISISRENNLNPLILFAISGQEQSFVPKQDPDSQKIANNPFNIYVSWKNYNTNIEDASRIACNTIINLCSDRPRDEEAFHWINRKYAADQNWYKGVSKIYKKLTEDQGIK